MKFNGMILAAMFLALTGFTWGSDDSVKSKTTEAQSAVTATTTTAAKKVSSYMGSSASASTSSSYQPAAGKDQRANAVRILTAGTEAERKARLESLTRIAKSMSARKQNQSATSAAAAKKSSFF